MPRPTNRSGSDAECMTIEMQERESFRTERDKGVEMASDSRNKSFTSIVDGSITGTGAKMNAHWTDIVSRTDFYVMLVLSLIVQSFYPLLNGNLCRCEREKALAVSANYQCSGPLCKAEIVIIQTQEIAQAVVLTVLLHSLREAKDLLTKHGEVDLPQLSDARSTLQKVYANGVFYLLYLIAVGWHKLWKRSRYGDSYEHVDPAITKLRTFFFWVSCIWAGTLVQMRVDALKKSSFDQNLGKWADTLKRLKRPQWVCAGLTLALAGFFIVPQGPEITRRVMIAFQAIRVFFWILQSTATIISVRAFWFTYKAVDQAKEMKKNKAVSLKAAGRTGRGRSCELEAESLKLVHLQSCELEVRDAEEAVSLKLVHLQSCELEVRDAEEAVSLQGSQVFGVIAMAASVSLMTFSTFCWSAVKFRMIADPELRRAHTLQFFINAVPRIFYSLSLGLTSVLHSGALEIDFGACRDQVIRASQREARRRDCRDASGKRRKSRHRPTVPNVTKTDPRYKKKVEELALRSVSLQSIMSFYKNLKHKFWTEFNREIHTTEDVVRQAIIPYSKEVPSFELELDAVAQVISYKKIIPYSREAGAYFNVMETEGKFPDRMVTHNWGNRFDHLVASVIADALDEPELDMIVYLLEKKPEELERWVRLSEHSNRRYWICAFAVNQHVSICSNRPKSGNVCDYKPCDCARPKYSNDDARCEMNKFKDMMEHVHSKSPRLEQLIAVDPKFELFNRAWCISEIHFSFEMGIKQHLKIPSRWSLEDHALELKDYRVENLVATREEDKKSILDGIDDKPGFAFDVKSLLFDQGFGLFKEWSMHRMTSAGRLVRFVKADVDWSSESFAGPQVPRNQQRQRQEHWEQNDQGCSEQLEISFPRVQP